MSDKPKWQPIDTAPDDGTEILSWSKKHGFAICSYTGHEDCDGEYEEGWIEYYEFMSHKIKPTHWMHIPKNASPEDWVKTLQPPKLKNK
jgi:hypothetical protein